MKRLVWYCRRCRKAIKVEPAGSMPKGCRCEVPQIGRPTTVWSP